MSRDDITTSTPTSSAEALDPSVLGERVGDDQLAAADYPADEPTAVEDPSILADGVIARDDVATRSDRLVDDASVDSVTADTSPTVPGLVETGADPDVFDAERTLIADAAEAHDDGPEAAAMHIDP